MIVIHLHCSKLYFSTAKRCPQTGLRTNKTNESALNEKNKGKMQPKTDVRCFNKLYIYSTK